MRTERRLLVTLAVLATALLLAGCPGSLENPEQFLGPCLDPPTEIFPQRCGNGDCHDADAPAGDLDLVSPGVETRIVGAEAAGGPGTLVDPAAPEESILWQKVTEDAPPFGTRMPQIGGNLSSWERQCVLEWIEEQTPAGSSP